ncbi:ATP-binding protein [Streptomyces sp. TRM 70351]|uniref:ATP-binding protein n=1 Tax=Streptomyces sp. TRM 70351 TaxID=3116552 RepID=UPI002E7C36E3|nr:ATP-binding protein [Streptomyces sp. TRM 70351]MEE1929513.1 ATP-binding protein [Streptomyces sp. TRM 70351]
MTNTAPGSPRNPFATVGHPVHGDDHVGRTGPMEILTERVLSQSTAGATAIIGPPRIGKSSLAYHVFMRPEARETHPRLLPVWMNVRTQAGIEHVFRRLSDDVWDLLTERSADIDRRVADAYQRAVEPDVPWTQAQSETQEFLRLVRRRGWRVVLILDEFDAAREVFKTQPGTFQALREIAYNLDWNIGLVTTSRRELREIVDMADPDESTFAGIFRSLFLTCFDADELGALASRVPGFSPDDGRDPAVTRLGELAGGHPYLASVLLDRVCSSARGGPLHLLDAIEELADALPAEFQYYYRDLEELLHADGRLRALLEVVLGPQLVVTPDDAQVLLQQGLVRVREGAYRAFSDDFQQYLTLVGRKLGHWDNWMAVERRIRDLVESVFEGKYGTDWPAELRRVRPKLTPMLDHCEELRTRELRSFGARGSTRILDFTYPRDLYDLMASHWDLFGRLWKKDKGYWNERFSLLAKVRNPMVHNRMAVVTPLEQRTFGVYCDEIMEVLDQTD